MGVIIGPTPWWQNNLIRACPVATTLPDGSRIICKCGGTAWIVAPSCTQVGSQWAGGQYNSLSCGTRCCICEWAGLNSILINCGFNPCDWFVPSVSELQMGYACRCNWDTFSSTCYWSSTEDSSTNAYSVNFSNGGPTNCSKSNSLSVRAFRRVTY